MPRWQLEASRWILAAAIAGAALAAGTVHTVTLCVATLALAVAAFFGWWRSDPMSARPVATLLLVTAIGLTLFTVLQSIPMPVSWLAKIAPHNADVWSRVATPFQESGPRWAPVSLDPVATRIEALKGVAYMLAFVTALRVARRREGVAFLSAVLVLTAVALAVAALLHPAFGANKLYGVWEPATTYGRHLAPLLNANNLASYLNIGFCLAFAAMLAPEPRAARPLLAAIVILLAGTQIWVASRGGVGTMILGTAIVLVISRVAQARKPVPLIGPTLVAGVVIVAGTFLLALGSSIDQSAELFDTGISSKLQLVSQALRMVPSFPIFGAGRGAFESVFPAFREGAGYITFTHPENIVAQWWTEWGVPVGSIGLVAMLWALRPNVVLARSTTAAGAWAALAVVGVQNLVDLGSEIPGLVLGLVICAAIVVGGTAGRTPQWIMERWARAPGVVAVVCAVTAALALALGAACVGHALADDRRALERAAGDAQLSVTNAHRLARSAMLRHPAEPYLPFAVALRAMRTRDDNPLPFLEAVLERARVHGPAHFLLARWMIPRSSAQARLEYRLAMEQNPRLVGLAIVEAFPLVHSYSEATELLSDGEMRLRQLDELAERLGPRLPAASERLDEELLRLAPTRPNPLVRLARDRVDDVAADSPAPWCVDEHRRPCLDEAQETAEAAERAAPERCDPRILHARASIAAGDPDAGLALLAQASEHVFDRVSCLQALALLAGAAHNDRQATAAIDKIASAGCVEDSECARNLAWAAQTEERYGHPQRALGLYRRAHERDPNSDAVLQASARLASSVGLHGEAADNYLELARKHPNDPKWMKAVSEERAAAVKSTVQL